MVWQIILLLKIITKERMTVNTCIKNNNNLENLEIFLTAKNSSKLLEILRWLTSDVFPTVTN